MANKNFLVALTSLIALTVVSPAFAAEVNDGSAKRDVANMDDESAKPDVANADPPLAGFHNQTFYLRDRRDVFRLYVQGRVHVDFYGWAGPGVSSLSVSNALRPTLFLRRARPELGGEFFHYWQWLLGVDLAPSTADNAAGTTDAENCAVNATTGALTCTPQTNPVQAPLQKPAPTDAYVNFGPSPWFNLQVGQFLLPFTMENRVSDNTTPFLERSLAVRNIGAPLQRDIGAMIWGESPNKIIYYAAGVFNGDGPNRPNQDSRFDETVRVFMRPLAAEKKRGLLPTDAQVGVSARYGSRETRYIGYDMPSLTTQGGYGFWKPTYKDSLGRLVHIIPSGDQSAIAFDAYVPIGPVDLAAEFIYNASDTREAVDGYQLSGFTERTGALVGFGYYVEAGVWLIGDRSIIGFPNTGKPVHLDLKEPEKQARQGVQVLAKFEQLGLAYHASSRGGADDQLTPSGDVDVLSFSLGVNYWATRHLRVGFNYGYYFFATQRAIGPAQTLAKGVDDPARDGGHDLHEFSVRFGVQF